MRYKLHQAKKCESLTPSSTGNRSHCQSHVSIKTHGCIAHLTSHRIHSISFTLSSLPQRANTRCQKKERKKNASSFLMKNNQIHTHKKNHTGFYSGVHVHTYRRSVYKKSHRLQEVHRPNQYKFFSEVNQ